MVKARGDTRTLDQLDWEPAPIVEAFAPERVRAVSLRTKVARGVSEALKDCEHSRAVVAERMSEFMGETVSVNMMNAYASEARKDHSMPFIRLLGLIHATDDVRLLQLGAEMIGYSVVEDSIWAGSMWAGWRISKRPLIGIFARHAAWHGRGLSDGYAGTGHAHFNSD